MGHTLPGLTCLAALRDLGAEVVRVERPARAGEAGAYAGLAPSFPTRSLRAGTSQVALDLKRDAGRDAFRRLVARADAVLEGFRPGVAVRLGIDHETLRAGHPELVVAALSGYGQDSPWRERAGHDVNYLAETGVLGLANPRGLPGATFADGQAGLCAALNLVAALLVVARTGRGAFLDLAIVDGPLFLMASELEHFWQTGESRGPGATHLTGRYPWYGVHATRDGGALAVGAPRARAGRRARARALRLLPRRDRRPRARRRRGRGLTRGPACRGATAPHEHALRQGECTQTK